MKYYLFSPLIGEDGKPVVRTVNSGEYYYHDEDLEVYKWPEDMDQTYKEFPILTMQTFEEDPFGEIREVYSKYKEHKDYFEERMVLSDGDSMTISRLWQAISATMKRLEEGRKV